MKNVFVAFLTLLAILLLIVEPGKSFNCDDARNHLFPCLNYIIGLGGDTPSSECCNGVRAVDSSSPTTTDRRAVCECLKELAKGFPLIRDDKTSSLLLKCGLTRAFSFSKDVNCQT
ncbi:putative plant lipid transfer protein/Par allergen [Lupinus albus]|uniref:Non-specific lipid-transfer protein n=1 Tax=Lupinus albus TaxID=3870 RepID=A0A6A4QE87_LUPAL|nr:putative plant lipid transfer protein/Par allergen [Lupinus albus]